MRLIDAGVFLVRNPGLDTELDDLGVCCVVREDGEEVSDRFEFLGLGYGSAVVDFDG